jgi:hypothetical protein
LEAQTTLHDKDNPFGEVTGGFLRLRAKLSWIVGKVTGTDWDNRWSVELVRGTTKNVHDITFRVDVPREWRGLGVGTDVSFWYAEMVRSHESWQVDESHGLCLEEAPCGTNTGGVTSDGRGTVFRRVGTAGMKISTKSFPSWFDVQEFEWGDITIV